MARGVAVVRQPTIARDALAAELISQAHEARKREKSERHKMADGLVDLAIENRSLRREIDRLRGVIATIAQWDEWAGRWLRDNPRV